MEPYAESWAPEWKHGVKKEVVVETLVKSLTVLRKAADAKGASVEIFLAAGVGARFAHNVDVAGAGTAGIELLESAVKRFRSDLRPEWFLGANLCQTTDLAEGFRRFKSVEARASPARLPGAFWRDYLRCATVAGMAAHAARAGKALASTDQVTEFDAILVERARGLLRRADRKERIELEQAWRVTEVGGHKWLTSRPFGFSTRLSPEQKWRGSPVNEGVGFVQLQLGPFSANGGEVFPSIVVVARAQRGNETLDDFAKRTYGDDAPEPLQATDCPRATCQEFLIRRPEAYPGQGGGLYVVRVFVRDEPEFPGVAIEQPEPFSSSKEGKAGEVRYYSLLERRIRIPGRIYYSVGLDTTVSVAEKAKKEYQRFLKELVVE